jgi:hypothetical protein
MSTAVRGKVRLILRLEGLCVMLLALIGYGGLDYGWGIFALLFLLPDLSFAGYLAGPRIGAAAYNAAHAYVGPFICLAMGHLLPHPMLFAAGTIWGAHVGFDRMLGYGLKYPEEFGYTHLGRIGRRKV